MEGARQAILLILHIAQPIQIGGSQQPVIDEVLLPPQFVGEINQQIGMGGIDLIGNPADCLKNACQRFRPCVMLVSFSVTAGGFAISVKNGGQIEFDVTQMVTADQFNKLAGD